MLAVLALALSCAGCMDRSPALAIPPDGSPKLLGLVACTVDVARETVVCEEPAPGGDGVSLALLGTNQIKMRSANNVSDTAAQVFSFEATAQNLLTYSIGTPDGHTKTGLKVFFETGPTVTAYYSPGDTGSVTVRNPDGYQNFTGPQQPYHFYDTILAPQEITKPKRWEYNVPRTVQRFGFTVRMFTAVPGEPTIPATPPNGWLIPEPEVDALFAHSNLIIEHSRVSGPYPRDVVLVLFNPESTAEERQAALDQVGGTVVGGDGVHYYLRVSSGAEPVWWAIDRLVSLPQVQEADPLLYGAGPAYRRPNNGPGWQRGDWEVHPDSARGSNWGPEAIAAPGAWGCETGAGTFGMAVVDVTEQHGQLVGAIVSNHANTGAGTTGMMWNSSLLITDASRGGTVTGRAREANVHADLGTAFQQGVRVINLSLTLIYFDSTGAERLPRVGNAVDIARARRYANQKRRILLGLEAAHPTVRPLYVIAAGNYQVDASYSGWPQLGTTGALASRTIVVAAHDSARIGSNRALWANSGDALTPGSNTGGHIAAPGANLLVQIATGAFSVRGTSFAAPHVTGIAGLLLSRNTSLDAQALRTYIMEGATRGNRTSGGHPMANAYESLRRAAEQTGSPLCGNRVWAESGQVYARRAGGVNEPLGPAESTNAPFEVEPLHGGRHVTYNTTAGRRTLVWQPGGAWQQGALPGDWTSRLGGTTQSVFGASHGNDSTVSVNATNVNDNEWWRTADQMEVPVLRDGAELGRITVNDLPGPTRSICVERVEFDPNDPAHPICTLTYHTSRWWLFRLAYPQAYQPVLVSVSPIQVVLADSTAWRACTHDPTLECRNVRSHRLEEGTRVYRLPLTGGTPVLMSDLPGGPVFWMGHTEVVGRPTPADTVVLGRGKWKVERWFDPDRYWQTGDGYTLITGEIENCGIEYRALAGFSMGQRIETTNVCNWNYLDFPSYAGGGTIAPYRAPAPETFAAPGGPPARRVNAAFTGGRR